VSQILDRLEKEGVSEVNTNVGRKFGYVVSCQVYGKMKMNQDSKVHHQLHPYRRQLGMTHLSS
jgi:hypothetical protein